MNSAFLKAIKFSKCFVALAFLLNNVAYAYSSIEEEIASLENSVSPMLMEGYPPTELLLRVTPAPTA